MILIFALYNMKIYNPPPQKGEKKNSWRHKKGKGKETNQKTSFIKSYREKSDITTNSVQYAHLVGYKIENISLFDANLSILQNSLTDCVKV